MGLTTEAASFVAGLRYQHVPQQAVATMTRGFIDCVAVMLLGREEPVTQIVRRFEGVGAEGEASVGWGAARARADIAALIDATAAHSLDFDDTGLDGHTSAVLVPVVLALGEACGANGRDLLTAYAAGYEVWAELISRDADRHHAKGFHPSAIFGPVAAAAAAANLLKLDEASTAAALSMAASLAGGLVANFGSMTKPFQLGRAAQSGVMAARLAASGMTAAPDALEHGAGFLNAFSPHGKVDRAAPARLGAEWRLLHEGLNIKLYPVCYAMHRAIDSMLSARQQGGVDASQVAALDVTIGQHQANMLRNAQPQTALEAKFSIQFAMASALLAGNVGMGEVSDRFVAQPDVQNLMRLVRVAVSNDADPEQPLFSPADHAGLALKDGRKIVGPSVRFAAGHARNPVDEQRLRIKFDDCIGERLAATARDRLFARLLDLPALKSVADLRA